MQQHEPESQKTLSVHTEDTQHRIIKSVELVNSVHAERSAPGDKEVSSKIGQTIQQLAEFLGAKEVVYTARVPAPWKNSLC
jgi:uncharacterized protein YcaQ